ncbi:MAG: hypothetical protein RL367_1134 [Pseudomonadota bacterium]|jgi:quercetin dioxygenase-like cupin family protein
MTRRIITGLNATGQSTVLIDGPVQPYSHGGGGHVWRSETVPADNSPTADISIDTFSYDLFHDGGSNFFVVEMAPGDTFVPHATDTLDYIVIMQGEVVLVVDTGEVTLRAGDCIADRGILHTWRNDSAAPATYAVITLPAHPVGKGRNV